MRPKSRPDASRSQTRLCVQEEEVSAISCLRDCAFASDGFLVHTAQLSQRDLVTVIRDKAWSVARLQSSHNVAELRLVVAIELYRVGLEKGVSHLIAQVSRTTCTHLNCCLPLCLLNE